MLLVIQKKVTRDATAHKISSLAGAMIIPPLAPSSDRTLPHSASSYRSPYEEPSLPVDSLLDSSFLF
jgi:hypothetical protein